MVVKTEKEKNGGAAEKLQHNDMKGLFGLTI